MSEYACSFCGQRFRRRAAEAKRSRRLFCSLACSGRARQKSISDAEKRRRKSEYDRQYRANNAERRRRQKAEYHRRTYDPIAARAMREANAEKIAAYKRAYYTRPENKAAKAEYDRRRRASRYGAYANCHITLVELVNEIRERAPWYERAKERGYYTRTAQERKRDAGISRH